MCAAICAYAGAVEFLTWRLDLMIEESVLIKLYQLFAHVVTLATWLFISVTPEIIPRGTRLKSPCLQKSTFLYLQFLIVQLPTVY